LKKLDHLEEIYSFYDCFIIDLWGVMHDGVKPFENSLKAVENLIANGKRVVFLSNAPRPSRDVINFLKIKLNIKKEFLSELITSGEAAFEAIQKEKFGKKFFHLGPNRDNSLYNGLEKNKTTIEDSDFILCTGLFDDKKDNLKYYQRLLSEHIKKKFICTNPDLTVHKGDREEYCAGSVAKLFEEIGGKVIYFGKPHSFIYDMCLKKNEKTLVIGDNLRTDIKGANNFNLDSIFISSGVHRSEFNSEKDLTNLLQKYGVRSNFFQNRLVW